MNQIKKLFPDIIAIIAFILISFAYFYPASLEGRVIEQHDSIAAVGLSRESQAYPGTRWTDAIFGGMPTYQIAPSYPSTSFIRYLSSIYRLFLPGYVSYLFLYLLGFYILMRAFNFRPWLSALGSITWAFSSYFFIIIAAGHIWKVLTLAYIPPTIAGMVLAYRGKYAWGFLVTSLFAALQLQSNHLQMTYYFLFMMLFMFIAYGKQAWKEKNWKDFSKATVTLVAAGCVAIALNLSNIYHTYAYAKESIRGKSELVKPSGQQAAGQATSGLERSYITQWSYGIGETWSFLIPNVKGGASVPLSENRTAMEKANPTYMDLYSQIGQYWGEQPGTSGPVYVGAFVLFLCLLGCFFVKGPIKWALIGGTIFSILLSWGQNFMGLTDFFIDYVPLYNKFRAVSSILVVAEFTIPVLAIMALKRVLDNPSLLKERWKVVAGCMAVTGGASLVFALAPHAFFGEFISSAELAALQNAIPTEHLGPILSNLNEMRTVIFTADAWRSLFIILIGCTILALYYYNKVNTQIAIISIAVICIGDMWTVNKRYLNDSMFVRKGQNIAAQLRPTETNLTIMKDKTLGYRVLNLASNTFNENNTAMFHNSIGGYHAAKLRRYQELIDHYIQPEMQEIFKQLPAAGGDMQKINSNALPVLNMLNTRYLIFPIEGGKTTPIFNPHALGTAWFVNQIHYVDNANQELEGMQHFNPKQTAVANKKFETALGKTSHTDSTATVKMLSYRPNHLVYESQSAQEGLVVFSEIYYPEWRATIDGKEVEIGRANYVLRAIRVPAGNHRIELIFEPQSIKTTETIAYIAIGIFVLVTLYLIGISVFNRRRKEA